jgi:hypothetical protein
MAKVKNEALERAIVAAINGIPRYTAKGATTASHGVHSVISGIFQNVVKAHNGDKAAAIATFKDLADRKVIYQHPTRGGFMLATSPFPVTERAAKPTASDGFFKS